MMIEVSRGRGKRSHRGTDDIVLFHWGSGLHVMVSDSRLQFLHIYFKKRRRLSLSLARSLFVSVCIIKKAEGRENLE